MSGTGDFKSGDNWMGSFDVRLGTGLQVKQDNLHSAKFAIDWLAKQDVLVGIPEEETDRVDGTRATNSLIGYAHEFGVPENNLPPRPFLIPGIENTEQKWTASLNNAARRAFSGDQQGALDSLERAGDAAANGARAVIRAQDFEPLAERTIEERIRKIIAGYKGGAKMVAKYRKLSTRDQVAWEAANIKILQDTNQLFKSITYVVRER
jgi:hypothetical protein